jgi:hypothetical protein
LSPLPSLVALAAMDRSALATIWRDEFGVPAPKSCQAPLLRQALAWQQQMHALRQVAGEREAGRAAQLLRQAAVAPAVSALYPGIRLLREWQGRTHHVVVVSDGYEYDGKVWRSLSAIARAITGTRWSGPKFFGLNS